MELSELREEIDSIDNELVRLFVARMDAASRVADYKKANNLPIYVPGREREVLQSVAEKAGPEMANYTRVLYTMLFELSRSYQSKRNTDTTSLSQQMANNATSCQDKSNSRANSIYISKNLEIYPEADKTRIMMILPHKPGSLYKVIARMYVLGINIIKLESHPIPDTEFEFMLYFDLETSICSEEFLQLICELDEFCKEFKYLGSYSEVV